MQPITRSVDDPKGKKILMKLVAMRVIRPVTACPREEKSVRAGKKAKTGREGEEERTKPRSQSLEVVLGLHGEQRETNKDSESDEESLDDDRGLVESVVRGRKAQSARAL